jgi:hypothetical protein
MHRNSLGIEVGYAFANEAKRFDGWRGATPCRACSSSERPTGFEPATSSLGRRGASIPKYPVLAFFTTYERATIPRDPLLS